jgi:hypothetical protein
MGENPAAPVLLPDLHEVHLPITPCTLLTITPFRSFAANPELSHAQATIVNQAIVRCCSNVVLRHPDMAWPNGLFLPRTRAPLAPPKITLAVSPDGSRTTPTWPVLDTAMAEALEILGGDPNL